jgi:Uma2 family endonuclease
MISIMVPVHSGLRVSDRAFWRICRDNRDLRFIRTAERELLVTPPAGTESSRCNASLTAQLWNWNELEKLGKVFDSSAGYTLPNGFIHAPDASWIETARWEAIPRPVRRRFAPICPTFVAELMSPSDRRDEVRGRCDSSSTKALNWVGFSTPKPLKSRSTTAETVSGKLSSDPRRSLVKTSCRDSSST